MTQHFHAFCQSEYEVLHKVILCEPEYMSITEVINATQQLYSKDNINQKLALKEHREFAKALQDHGVEVLMIPPNQLFPEQVFTRDIGFTLGDTLFVAEMARGIRKGEENEFKKKLDQQSIPFVDLTGGMIEGGDVIVDGDTIYVGISGRTNQNAVNQLEKKIPDYNIITIPISGKYLHLDCVFNILSPNEALIYPDALSEEIVDMLASRFQLIEVTEEEQFTLATNVFSIGNKQVFCMPINQRVNQILRKRGYSVIEVDLSEIIKSGGAFRCCTLPILRK